MTNIYVSWEQLKNLVLSGNTLYYALKEWNWQLYVLIGSDAYICYIPRPDRFSEMIIDDETRTKAENDFNDFNTNFKANAVETQGVKD